MLSPLKYLLALPLLVSLHSHAVPAAATDEYLDQSLNFNASMYEPINVGEWYLPLAGNCFDSLNVPCVISSDYSPLFEMDGELYFGHNGLWFPVKHLYAVSMGSGFVTSYYFNEDLREISEVPLPGVGLWLFSATSMFLAAMGRRRRLTAKDCQ
ncbi:hypothetical protein [Oceanicoccus sagamiensis]|uniref:PEP-CTERM protein-sorting domain-containing protein n=1 Tax=Oceanicoccus sagamiensis TaxID=716816 RepID=A0A1X9NGS7_9GAMM|nr:hypothetical protein [Oceanicoccus sagamiensis]ARN73213.1 hypothetical protein BST96_03280 [Oceanicoccus sagamiensis]